MSQRQQEIRVIIFSTMMLFLVGCASTAEPEIEKTAGLFIETMTPIITLTPSPTKTVTPTTMSTHTQMPPMTKETPLATSSPLTVDHTSTAVETPEEESGLSFRVPEEIVDVIWNEDGSLSLIYQLTFTNDYIGAPIDFVDISIPSDNYELQEISAEVDGQHIEHVAKSTYIDGSVELGLALNAIPSGETGHVIVQIYEVHDVLFTDPADNDYVNALFFPTWFATEFTYGTTDTTVIFHLPLGIDSNEVIWHQAPPGFSEQPNISVDDAGRTTGTWNNFSANAYTQYLFGVSIPASSVPEATIIDFAELYPGYISAYINRGNAYGLTGDYEQAIADYNQAITLEPELAEAYYFRGIAYAMPGKQNSTMEALTDMSTAIAIDPDFASAYYFRGLIYAELDDEEAAISDLERALEIGLEPKFQLDATRLLQSLQE